MSHYVILEGFRWVDLPHSGLVNVAIKSRCPSYKCLFCNQLRQYPSSQQVLKMGQLNEYPWNRSLIMECILFHSFLSILHYLSNNKKSSHQGRKKWEYCHDLDCAGSLFTFGWLAGPWAGYRTTWCDDVVMSFTCKIFKYFVVMMKEWWFIFLFSTKLKWQKQLNGK